MPLTIRPYQHSDQDAVLACWESANRLAHPFLPTSFVDQVRRDIPALYLPNADTWVAQKAGMVVGFIALIGHEVAALFVATDHHGTGVGTALMDHAHTLHPTLEVEVFQDNAIGSRFYRAYGFVEMSQSIHAETGNPLFRLRCDG